MMVDVCTIPRVVSNFTKKTVEGHPGKTVVLSRTHFLCVYAYSCKNDHFEPLRHHPHNFQSIHDRIGHHTKNKQTTKITTNPHDGESKDEFLLAKHSTISSPLPPPWCQNRPISCVDYEEEQYFREIHHYDRLLYGGLPTNGTINKKRKSDDASLLFCVRGMENRTPTGYQMVRHNRIERMKICLRYQATERTHGRTVCPERMAKLIMQNRRTQISSRMAWLTAKSDRESILRREQEETKEQIVVDEEEENKEEYGGP